MTDTTVASWLSHAYEGCKKSKDYREMALHAAVLLREHKEKYGNETGVFADIKVTGMKSLYRICREEFAEDHLHAAEEARVLLTAISDLAGAEVLDLENKIKLLCIGSILADLIGQTEVADNFMLEALAVSGDNEGRRTALLSALKTEMEKEIGLERWESAARIYGKFRQHARGTGMNLEDKIRDAGLTARVNRERQRRDTLAARTDIIGS